MVEVEVVNKIKSEIDKLLDRIERRKNSKWLGDIRRRTLFENRVDTLMDVLDWIDELEE